ncbi:unnamed protein product, partial [Meganyctiphanes norvegica]
MTVTYRHEIVTSSKVGTGFGKLLWRWNGSIYRLLLADFIAYSCLYAFVSIIYRLALSLEQQIQFAKLVVYCESFSGKIPLGFVLGFYCSIVAGRWWMQYQAIPWPDTLCMHVTTNLKGDDDEARMMRRNIARYANLAINIAFVKMSPQAKDRFDTLDKFVEEVFLLHDRKKFMSYGHIPHDDQKKICSNPSEDHMLLAIWNSLTIGSKSRAEGKISTDLGCKAILCELTSLRSTCGGMLSFAWINVPLVYTQVVTIAVYSFFLTTLIGRQYIGKGIDLYVPIMTLLQFLFYMGWLKTAETLLNPFGDDDDDFEILYLIDRNHEMGYVIVDKMHTGHPELSQDIHWDSVLPPSNKVAIKEVEDLDGRKDEYIPLQEPVNDDSIGVISLDHVNMAAQGVRKRRHSNQTKDDQN